MGRVLFFFVFLLSLSSRLYSQFTSISHPTSNSFEFAEIDENDGVAIIGGIKALKSIDGGFTWTEMDLGLFGMPYTVYTFTGAIIISPQIYCLVGRDDTNNKSIIIRTDDGGASWSNVLESSNGSNDFYNDICFNGNVAIVVSDGGIHRSTDNGQSWSFVSVPGFSSYSYSDHIQYNELTDVWVIEEYDYTKYKSTDDGVTWSSVPTFNYPGTIKHIGNNNNEFLFTWSTFTSSAIFSFDENLNCVDTILIDDVKTRSTSLLGSFYLPDDDILSFSNGYFLKIDTTTENVYYYDHNLIDPNTLDFVETVDFDLDQSYGLAVGKYGGLSRFDLGQINDVYVPADFNVMGITCPGDTLFAEPLFDYADSVKWFYDGNFVSDDINLVYETPHQFGTFDLVHHTWYNGNMKSDTQEVYFEPLFPADDFSFNYVDTMPCYNDGAYVSVNVPGNTNWNGALEIWLDDLMIDSIAPQPTSNFSLNTPVIASQDTLYLISKYEQGCGTTVDSNFVLLYPGDNLMDDFQLVNDDSTLCIGDLTQIELINTNTEYNYDFTISNDYTSSVDQFTLNGMGTDTMFVNGPYGVADNNYHYENTNYFFEMVISDVDENCETSVIYLDTLVCIDPRSLFHTHSKNYYRNDTIEITNVRIKENRLWNASPNGLNELNLNDTTPVFYGDTVGIYEIELTNSPAPGCESSSTEYVSYGDTLEPMNIPNCQESLGESRHTVMSVQLDQQGNIYELGVFDANSSNGSGKPGFHLLKRDPLGQLLWQRKSNTFNFYGSGAVIEDIDFDHNGDVYAALWVDSETSYQFDLISYTELSPQNHRRGYVVKLDGTTGDMIWARDLADYPLQHPSNPNLTSVWRIMGVSVVEDQIHFSVGTNQTFEVASIDSSGGFIQSSMISGILSPNNHLIYTGSMGSDRQSQHSPKLKKMSDGDILGIAYYNGSPYLNGVSTNNLDIQNNTGIMAFKYNAQDGIFDLKKIVELGQFDAELQALDGIPMFDLDKDNNISLGFSFREEDGMVTILDSSFTFSEGTCLMQMDSDFNLNWVSKGSYSYLHSVEVAYETGETFISGICRDNISFETAGQVGMMGEYGTYTTEYGTQPFNFWELETYQYKPSSAYIARFDVQGIPNGGYFFNNQDTVNFCSYRMKNEIDITPCGDIVAVMNLNEACVNGGTLTGNFIEDNLGASYQVDSSKTWIFTNQCSNPTCSMVQINQDTVFYCSYNDSLYFPFDYSFGVDSIMFEIVENGIVLGTETMPEFNNGFYFAVPNNNSNYILNILSPASNHDSIHIIINSNVPPTYSYLSEMCGNSSQQIFDSNNTYQYEWLNSSMTVDSLTYNQSIFNSGLNQLDVIATDEFGCKFYDTLEIFVYDPILPNLNGLYSLGCYTDTVLPILSSNYLSQDWTVNGMSTNNFFSETNLNIGLNNIEVNLIDTNSCSTQSSTMIDYCYDLSVPLEGFTLPEIYPNPNDGTFTLDLGDNTKPSRVTIFSLEGKEIYRNTVSQSGKFVVNFNAVPGVYRLYIETEDYSLPRKIVVY